MTPGELIRRERERRGLTQARLALRAGTEQAAISRIEAGKEEVTWQRLRAIMLAMGLEPSLDARPLEHEEDMAHVAMNRELSPGQRIEGAANVAGFVAGLHVVPRPQRE